MFPGAPQFPSIDNPGAYTASFSLSATSPAAAGTVAGKPILLTGFRSLSILATLTGATGDTLDVYLQVSPDGGVTWVDGYVMDGIPDGVTPSKTAPGNVTAQLAPATPSVPGGMWTDSTPSTNGIDISHIWVDGDHPGDPIIVSYDTQLPKY
jgi:hypothetical protein